MNDGYRTLAAESEGGYREKASRFIAHAFPIADEASVSTRCAAIAKEHHASRHVCHAWVLGEAGDRSRVNDAGEPPGTAGRPILRRLQAEGITFAAVVVVRYFGGTLLGKGGLVRAYGEAARAAIAANTIVERVLCDAVTVRCGYAQVEGVKNDVLAAGGTITATEYDVICTVRALAARAALGMLTERWRRAGADVVLDQAK